ncbi:MAG: PQQ-binding-like beta-propeller repeat protein [Bacteroidetes bacterium]|nr:PQQ-binding-like beta-propeller repeat protein [Bacteroidota bacterium]
MKKIIFISVALMLASCTQPILLKYYNTNGPGIRQYGITNERMFFHDVLLGDSLELVWQNETTGSFGNFSPIIVNNYLIVSDLAGTVTVFDRITGLKIGFNDFDGEIGVTPIVSDNKLFLPINNFREHTSQIINFDFTNSKILSKSTLKGNCVNEIIKTDDAFYILTDKGSLHKFNLVGYEIGMLETKILTQSNPAAKGNRIYWGNQEGEIVCADLEKLEIIYRKKVGKPFEAGVTIKDNYGFIGNAAGNVVCFNLDNGDILWTSDLHSKIKSDLAYDDNSVYVPTVSGLFFSLDISDGDINYEIDTKGVLNATPLIFRDNLILPDLNQHLYVINKTNGTIIQSIEFERRVKMTPVLFDDLIYAGADRGQVYAFKFPGEKL